MSVVDIARRLAHEIKDFTFGPPVSHVYNPLEYAWRPHKAYLERWARAKIEVLLVGMNPGPFGMVQTGVPFGEVNAVRDWLEINEPISQPAVLHPKRPILGLDCPRSEVSGARLWAWARQRFGQPDLFFRRFFVTNYCPLAFLEESGRNLTPNRLRSAQRSTLFAACDRALRGTVEDLSPRFVVGIGSFAEERVKAAVAGLEVVTGRILHPSPANPSANRGWVERAELELREIGVRLECSA